jgi:hypothetical protein
VLCSTSDVTEPSDVYQIALAPPARRAITGKLPADVAAAAVDFITGPLIGNPRRLGKPLHAPLDGTWSARLMRVGECCTKSMRTNAKSSWSISAIAPTPTGVAEEAVSPPDRL